MTGNIMTPDNDVPDIDTLLNLEEASKRLGVSTRTVRREIQKGRLGAYKLAGKWRFKEEDIRAYFEQARVEPKPKHED